MLRLKAGFITALALLLALSVVGPVSAADPLGKVRVVHDSPDAPNVDIIVKGGPFAVDTKVLSNVAYGTISGYLSVPRATYHVKVNVAGTSTIAIETDLAIGMRPLTVAAIGSLKGDGAAFGLKVLNDRVGIRGNWALLRVAHTSPDAPAVDVQLRLGRLWIPIIRDLSFGENTRYLPLPAKNPWTGRSIKYDLRIVAAGTNGVVKNLYDTTLAKGRAQTVWAVGFLSPTGGNTNGFGVKATLDGR